MSNDIDIDEAMELRAIREAWHLMCTRPGQEKLRERGAPLCARLFAAIAEGYEGGEDDPPELGVIGPIVDDLDAWVTRRSSHLVFAGPAYSEIRGLMRRVEVVAMLIEAQDRARRDGLDIDAKPAPSPLDEEDDDEKKGGAS